jgi:hypothetical protein
MMELLQLASQIGVPAVVLVICVRWFTMSYLPQQRQDQQAMLQQLLAHNDERQRVTLEFAREQTATLADEHRRDRDEWALWRAELKGMLEALGAQLRGVGTAG